MKSECQSDCSEVSAGIEIHASVNTSDRNQEKQIQNSRTIRKLHPPSDDPDIPFKKPVSSIQACKTRAILTEAQAITIFHAKPATADASIERACAAKVAEDYGVSDKTIRDIWKGRTWFRETMHLDPNRAAMVDRLKQPGRPKGSKDKERRQRGPARGKPAAVHGAPPPPLGGSSPPSPLGGARPTWSALLVSGAPVPSPAPTSAADGGPGEPLFNPSADPLSSGDDAALDEHWGGGLEERGQPSDSDEWARDSDDDGAAQAVAEAAGGVGTPAPATALPWRPESPMAAVSGGSAEPAAAGGAGGAAGDSEPPLPGFSAADDPFHDDWPYWSGPAGSASLARPGLERTEGAGSESEPRGGSPPGPLPAGGLGRAPARRFRLSGARGRPY